MNDGSFATNHIKFASSIAIPWFIMEQPAPWALKWNHYNKRCPCMPSDFIRFWVNSLVVINKDQWRSSEFTSLVNEDYWTTPTFCNSEWKSFKLMALWSLMWSTRGVLLWHFHRNVTLWMLICQTLKCMYVYVFSSFFLWKLGCSLFVL